MTPIEWLLLFAAMAALALVPDASAVAVAGRSIDSGWRNGLAVVGGILLGDAVFILVVAGGLSAIAYNWGTAFVVIKILAAGYLIWIGVGLWWREGPSVNIKPAGRVSLASSFLGGLFITLGDPKAIFFYMGILPAYVELESITYIEIGLILLAATLAVGLAKTGYAVLADRSRALFENTDLVRRFNRIAGVIVLLTAFYLLVTTALQFV